MPRVAKGHIERLPSGPFRVAVFAGYDPVTRRRQYFKSTVKTEAQAQIELGRLLEKA
jgi:integrase